MTAMENSLRPISHKRRPGRPSLTPLIDCVFILLVFFMLQTNFLRPKAIEFSKASGANASQSELTTVAVELHVNGSIWLNGEKSDMSGLRKLAGSIDAPNKTRVFFLWILGWNFNLLLMLWIFLIKKVFITLQCPLPESLTD